MDLEPKQREMLRIGMASAFQSYEVLRRFLNDNCDFDLNSFTDAVAGMETARDRTIEAATTFGWIDNLLAHCAIHTNQQLASVAKVLQDQLAKARPYFYNQIVQDPFSAVILGTEECFIGRDELRNALKAMDQQQGARRVLVVNSAGQVPACGKTYTYELLRLLDRLGNGSVVVKINFRDFRDGDLGARYRDIVEKINSRMKVPPEQMPKMNESQTRWFQNAIDKFEVVAREKGKKLWLVFDHIGTGEIEDKIADALATTAIYTISEASALRVILIDVDPARLKLEKPILNKLRSDSASLPEKKDVIAFLKEARRLSQKAAVTDPQIEAAATAIMTKLAVLSEKDRAYQYSQLAWEEAAKLQFVP